MLLTSITPHLLLSAGQLDASLHLHLVNIHSRCRDNMLSKIHAEPERMHMASQTNTHYTPQTGIQVHTRATPTEEVRLAFCCYCNSVIPRCRRPNGGQGVGFCCVCTLFGWQHAYPSHTQVNAFLPACLLDTSSPTVFPQPQDTVGDPSLLSCHLKSTIVTCNFLTWFPLNFTIGRVCSRTPSLLPDKRHNCQNK